MNAGSADGDHDHGHEDDELLEQILVGDKHEGDADVQHAFARSPELRRRLDRMRTIGAEIDALGSEGLRELESELATRTALTEQVERYLPRSAWSRRRVLAIALTAAAAITVALILWRVPDRGARHRFDDLYLDATDGRMSWTPASGEFAWTHTHPPRGEFRLQFWSLESGERLFDDVTVRDAQTWRASSEQLDRLSRGATWKLLVIGSDRRVISGQGGTAAILPRPR